MSESLQGAVAPPAPDVAAGETLGGTTAQAIVTVPASPADDVDDVPDVEAQEIVSRRTAYPASPALSAYFSKMPPLLVKARMEEMARMVVYSAGRVRVREISKKLGVHGSFVGACLRGEIPEYYDIQSRVEQEVWGTADDAIADEKMHEAARKSALKTRMITTLGEVMSLVDEHAKMARGGLVPAKAAILKAGVDAAAQVRQLVENEAAAGRAAPASAISITNVKATIIGGALREAGIDLSDILAANTKTIDAEVLDAVD